MLVAVALSCLSYLTNLDILFFAAEIISSVFVNMLKLISLPIIFLSVIASLSSIDNKVDIGMLMKKTLFYTLITTFVASLIALAIYKTFNPALESSLDENSVDILSTNTDFFAHLLSSLFPSNLIQAFLDNNVLGIFIIAFMFGIGTLQLPPQKKEVINSFFSCTFDVMINVSQYILKVMPIAVWAFMLTFLREMNSITTIKSLFLYIVCIVLSNLIQGSIFLPSLLKFHKIPPIQTFKRSLRALTVAFFSKSSSITLPVTLECMQKNLGISKEVGSFSLPICSTINMNACAAFILITVFFVSESNGYHFSTIDMISWLLLSNIAAIGNAGIPMGCYFMSMTYLVALGIPLNLMVIILPVYAIIDMLETALNVWSDICITSIINKKLSNKKNINTT